jgi:hypothetical protein
MKYLIPEGIKMLPPCACGNPDASWKGDIYGRREYQCDECYNYSRSGAANPWLGCGEDLRVNK